MDGMPYGATHTEPVIMRPRISIGWTCGSPSINACASEPTRTRRPPFPLTEQHMRPFTMKHRPPIIFFSTTSGRTDSSLRTRPAAFSSYSIGALCGRSRQDFREAVEAGLPASADVASLIGRGNVRVTHREARASGDRLQQVGHRRGRARCAGPMPGLYQFSWRVDLEEFSLERIGLAARDA